MPFLGAGRTVEDSAERTGDDKLSLGVRRDREQPFGSADVVAGPSVVARRHLVEASGLSDGDAIAGGREGDS